LGGCIDSQEYPQISSQLQQDNKQWTGYEFLYCWQQEERKNSHSVCGVRGHRGVLSSMNNITWFLSHEYTLPSECVAFFQFEFFGGRQHCLAHLIRALLIGCKQGCG
jgi:hypothetical protein